MQWYLATYHRTNSDLGTCAMFCDRERLGHLAASRSALASGEATALFRVLVASTLFQRLQDVLVFGICRGLGRSDARELASSRRLVTLAAGSTCKHLISVQALESCDLAKAIEPIRGICSTHPRLACHLKRHAVLLKRYGDFGKVPTSAALVLKESGAGNLARLRKQIFAQHASPGERAEHLVLAMKRIWRVDRKISSMFLSAVSNPDLSTGTVPWSRGLDWTRFIVIDSNVDSFLVSVGYRRGSSYADREAFIGDAAERIDLRTFGNGLHSYNPRIVQQAMYVFMSTTNRRACPSDCSRSQSCRACPRELRALCPLAH